MKEPIPYACFRWDGKVIELDKHDFLCAVQTGRLCGCGTCMGCIALNYFDNLQIDTGEKHA